MLENKYKLNVEIIENNSERIQYISCIEKILYQKISERLKNIPIEYLNKNDIIFYEYGFYIGYNPYNKSLQFYDFSDNCYIGNIRNILITNDISNVIEYIFNIISEYIEKYSEYMNNIQNVFHNLLFE